MDYIEPGSMKLRDFIEDSLARTGNHIRESTRRIAEAAMKDFIATIGNINFRSVTLADGELYLQTRLDRGNSNTTVSKRELSMISGGQP